MPGVETLTPQVSMSRVACRIPNVEMDFTDARLTAQGVGWGYGLWTRQCRLLKNRQKGVRLYRRNGK